MNKHLVAGELEAVTYNSVPFRHADFKASPEISKEQWDVCFGSSGGKLCWRRRPSGDH